MRLLARFRTNRDANVLVEFVLSVPMVLIVLFGCVEVGRLVLAYHDIDRQIRGATRFLARVPCPAVDTLLPAARNLALYGRTSGGTPILAYWTDPSTITLTSVDLNCTAPARGILTLTAAVAVPFPYLPFIGLPNELTISASHSERLISE